MDEKGRMKRFFDKCAADGPNIEPPPPREPNKEELQAFRDEIQRWQTAYRFDPGNFGGTPVLLWIANFLEGN